MSPALGGLTLADDGAALLVLGAAAAGYGWGWWNADRQRDSQTRDDIDDQEQR